MSDPVGVQVGRVCRRCGREDSIPLRYGMPGSDDVRQAERGVVALGGCVVPEDVAAFVCRSCHLEWGNESDPTADEAELAELLDVGYADVLRALGTGWRRETAAGGQDDVQWFVSGEPPQVAVGVQGPFFVLARPSTAWGEDRPGPFATDGPRFTRDDVRYLPHAVAEAAEVIASSRRRSFRWCRTCRRATPPEAYVSPRSCCDRCVSAIPDADE